jgi:ssDNA-binding replication factor A large subunit
LRKDEIINKILSSKLNLTREKLEKLIEEKKQMYKGLLSDEGAARLIAQEFLIELNDKPEAVELKIKDLVAGLNNVTLIARVIIDWPIQDFTKNNGEKSVVKKLLLADETGVIQCLIWGEKALTLQKAGELQGKIIKILHGYTKEGLKENVELHLGVKSSIIISPFGVYEKNFPEVTKFINKINEAKKLTKINAIGVVNSQPKISSFKSEAGIGKVLRVKISDSTGEAILVAWNEQAEKIKDIKIGDTIQIMNGKVIAGINGSIEIHAEKQTVLNLINKAAIKDWEKTLKIIELKPGVKNCNIKVKLIKKSELKMINVAEKKVLVIEALVGDETGLATITFWGENAKLIAETKENTVLTIINASAKLSGKFTALTAGKFAIINLNFNAVLADPPKTKINEIKNEGNKLLSVEGVIANISPVKEVVVKGEIMHVSSLTLKDETGEAELTFWGNIADEILNLKVGEKIKVLGVFLKKRNERIELSSIRLTKILHEKNR